MFAIYILGVVFFLLLIYYVLFLLLLFHKSRTNQAESMPPVSVIICVQNVESHIEESLFPFLKQEYPQYEVVVVNDHSTDATAERLMWMKHRFPHLKVVNLTHGNKIYPGKKFALSVGIKEATYERILLSDIDCKPASSRWIEKMMLSNEGNKEIILGVGLYERKKNLLNMFVRFDAFQIALLYLSAAKIGLPYMGIGRNLSYTRSLFFKHHGFSRHLHIASGDDDLFIQQVARRNNTAICTDPEGFVYSTSPSSWKKWFLKKSRHFTTSDFYNLKATLFSGLYTILQLFFFIFSVIFIFIFFDEDKVLLVFTACLVTAKILFQSVVYGLIAKKWKEKPYTYAIPFLEIFLILILWLPYINRKKFLHQWS
ncbi:MAG: glycosyltransferase [Bacteroidales bacterium]|nr:glycosyltransferase [Bacteroidales bacterium]